MFVPLAALLIIMTVSLDALADEAIKKGEALSLERCVAIALKKQPNILAARSAVNVSESRIGQARANYYPQIDLSSGYSKVAPVQTAANRSFSPSSQSYDQYTAGLTLKQNIYDFGKTAAQVRVQSLNLESSRSDLDNVTEQIIFNVKQAYFNVLQTGRARDVAEEAVRQFEQHLEQAKGFYEVGTKPRFDVTKAEVDLSNAKLSLIKADNALKVAKVTLNNAMGVPDAPEHTLTDNLMFQKFDISLSDAIENAFKSRPDLLSAIAKRKSAEASLEYATTGYYPSVSGNAGYSLAGENFPLGSGWNAGVTVSIPVFSGFLTKNQVEEARATLNQLKANEESLRQTVLLDVQQAYLNLIEAEERIPASDLAVRQAKENLDIANGRYAAGVGNPIEVTDAQVSYSNARITYIQALSDYKVATASLEKAMGIK